MPHPASATGKQFIGRLQTGAHAVSLAVLCHPGTRQQFQQAHLNIVRLQGENGIEGGEKRIFGFVGQAEDQIDMQMNAVQCRQSC